MLGMETQTPDDAEAKRVARNAYQLQYYHAHKEAINARRLAANRAYAREYYQENKEALKAKAQSAAGRESQRQRTRRCREKDPERAAALARQWAAANPEKCRAKVMKHYYKSKAADPIAHWALRVYHAAKTRAGKKSLPFDIDREYILSLCVTHCPALGLELTYNATGTPPNCASLDRIKPELGYVRGNVIVISYLANTIKQNATAFQVRAVGGWMLNMEGGE